MMMVYHQNNIYQPQRSAEDRAQLDVPTEQLDSIFKTPHKRQPKVSPTTGRDDADVIDEDNNEPETGLVTADAIQMLSLPTLRQHATTTDDNGIDSSQSSFPSLHLGRQLQQPYGDDNSSFASFGTNASSLASTMMASWLGGGGESVVGATTAEAQSTSSIMMMMTTTQQQQGSVAPLSQQPPPSTAVRITSTAAGDDDDPANMSGDGIEVEAVFHKCGGGVPPEEQSQQPHQKRSTTMTTTTPVVDRRGYFRRVQKRHQRARQAMEWLHSLQDNTNKNGRDDGGQQGGGGGYGQQHHHPNIVEAASSKFLRNNNNSGQHHRQPPSPLRPVQQEQQQQVQQRQRQQQQQRLPPRRPLPQQEEVLLQQGDACCNSTLVSPHKPKQPHHRRYASVPSTMELAS